MILKDPWVPGLPGFTVLAEAHLGGSYTFVRDLMNDAKTDWNHEVVVASFAPEVSSAILSIPINIGEQDAFVWTPSASGKFTVKSSYRTNNCNRFGQQSIESKHKWQLLWHSN